MKLKNFGHLEYQNFVLHLEQVMENFFVYFATYMAVLPLHVAYGLMWIKLFNVLADIDSLETQLSGVGWKKILTQRILLTATT